VQLENESDYVSLIAPQNTHNHSFHPHSILIVNRVTTSLTF
jgi:hypothetical protein